MERINIQLSQIHPSDSPSRASWERSRHSFRNFKVTLYQIAGYHMPMDGNHRLARLWDKYGPSHRITADLEVFTDPIDVKGFLSQIRDVQDLGIRTFADFLQMCREGNFDRD